MGVRATLVWFRVVCAILALEQVGLIALGWYLTQMPPPADAPETKQTLVTSGWLLMGCGALFVWPNLILAACPRKPWVWVAGLTNLAASLLCCPPGVLLLIPWLRSDVKRHFGMPQ